MRKKGDLLYSVIDAFTGENCAYQKVSKYADGTSMNDGKCDGVIYRKLNTEYFKRSFTGPLNVKWFGAKGDGVSDDKGAIKNALDLVQKLGCDIFFPQGVYITSESYEFSGNTSITESQRVAKKYGFSKIFGEVNTVIKYTGTGTWFQFNRSRQTYRVTFKDIWFIGPDWTGSSVCFDAVGLAGGTITFDATTIEGFGIGLRSDDQTCIKFSNMPEFFKNGKGIAAGYKSDNWSGHVSVAFNDIGIEYGYLDVRYRTTTPASYTGSLTLIANKNRIGVIVAGNGTNGIFLRNCYIENNTEVGVQVGNGTETDYVNTLHLEGCYIAGETPKPIRVLSRILLLSVKGCYFEGSPSPEAHIWLENSNAEKSGIEINNGTGISLRSSTGVKYPAFPKINYGRPTLHFSSNNQSGHTLPVAPFNNDFVTRGSANQNPFRAGRSNADEGIFLAGWQIKRDSNSIDTLEGVSSYLKPATFANLPTPTASYLGMIAVKAGSGAHTCRINASGAYEWIPMFTPENMDAKSVKITSNGSITNKITYSSSFSGHWTINSGVDATDNESPGFYGGNTLAKIEQTAGGSTSGVESLSFTTGATKGVLSVLVKAGTITSGCAIRLRNATTGTDVSIGSISPSSGFVSGTGWASVSLGSGLYRFYYTATGLSATDNYTVKIYTSYGSTQSGYIFAGDVQFDADASVLREYLPTTVSAVSSEALAIDGRNTSNQQKFYIRGNGEAGFDSLSLLSPGSYADNAAAAAANVPVGKFYVTTDGHVMRRY
jgi:hypothetical protein